MGKGVVAAAASAAALGAAAVVAYLRNRNNRKTRTEHSPIVLKNRDGVEVHILPVGASIQRLIVPTKDKKLDIVLGFNKASTYEVCGQLIHLSGPLVTRITTFLDRVFTAVCCSCAGLGSA